MREEKRRVLSRVQLASGREQGQTVLLVQPPELAERDGSGVSCQPELREPVRKLKGLSLGELAIAVT